MPTAIAFDTHEIAPNVFRRYLTIAWSIGVALMSVPIAMGLPVEPFILVVVFGPMLGGALLTISRSGGSPSQLFNGILRWRFGWTNWVFVMFAVPAATVTVAASTGTLTAPPSGWAATAATYLFSTFVLGALVLNLWEEVAWQGMIQRHLTGRFGQVKGVVLTAIPFALLHVPLGFAGDAGLAEALGAAVVLLLVAPPFRYLIGRIDQVTGGSLLAVAVLHASFNASGALDVIVGGWQHIAAVVAVAGVVLLSQRRQEGSTRRSAPGLAVASQGPLGETTHVHVGPGVGR